MGMGRLMNPLPISWIGIGLLARLHVLIPEDRWYGAGRVVRKDVDVNVGSSQLRESWKSCNIGSCILMPCSLLPRPSTGRFEALTVHLFVLMPSDLVYATRNDLR
jgi:hypothetical protein